MRNKYEKKNLSLIRYRIKCLTFGSVACILFAFLLFSCSSNDKKNKIEQKIDNAPLLQSAFDKKQTGVNYKIPSPMELFVYLESNKIDYVAEILHHPLKYKDYISNYKKGLNFGVYSADLAYATINNNQQDAILYFKAAKELASGLGLYEGYGQQMAQRINDNLENVDSLINIAADSYNQSVIFLESQGLSELLSYILVGGWIEALYIGTQSVQKQDLKSPVIERIADQQILLDNLLNFLNVQKQTNQIDTLILLLKELQEEFDALYFNDEETIITTPQFVNITNKVSDIRNKMISVQ